MTRLRIGPSPETGLPGDRARVVDTEAVRDDQETTADVVTAFVGAIRDDRARGAAIVEVVVDGWRFELVVEDDRRAALRDRATRARDAGTASGPSEIRAIIPGRVAAVLVTAGDAVEPGQGLLVVEAMKMQNELRATRGGTVERVAVEAGQTIDNGDLLMVVR
jgi:biotin carboxyl carrier protein